MRKFLILTILASWLTLGMNAQSGLKKVYNEDVNPIEQIDKAIVKAKSQSVRSAATGAPGA